MTTSIGAQVFSPLATVSPANVLTTVGFWSVSNGKWDYTIQLSWPLNWTPPLENSIIETMYNIPFQTGLPDCRLAEHEPTDLQNYALDRNALGLSKADSLLRNGGVQSTRHHHCID